VPESRRFARKPLHPPVTFQGGDGQTIQAHCENISLGGMYITTDSALPNFGAKVTLLVEFPGASKPFEVEATVRWTKPGGMGVQFGVMGVRETHALTELLASLSMRPPQG